MLRESTLRRILDEQVLILLFELATFLGSMAFKFVIIDEYFHKFIDLYLISGHFLKNHSMIFLKDLRILLSYDLFQELVDLLFINVDLRSGGYERFFEIIFEDISGKQKK